MLSKTLKKGKAFFFCAIFVILCSAFLSGCGSRSDTEAQDPNVLLYQAAVEDAETIEKEEVLPLRVAITSENPYTTWNEEGRVLVATWNRHPEYYEDGGTYRLGEDPLWVFSPDELNAWYKDNRSSIFDLDLRLEQLIGLPPDSGYSTMTSFWVEPEELQRPAYSQDITDIDMATEFAEGTDTEFQHWFEANMESSYEAEEDSDGYPWTRLGYTFDWAANGTEYGLTEFLIKPGAEVEIAESVPTRQYFSRQEERESSRQILGESEIRLDGTRERVRSQETNLADFLCDAVLWSANQQADAGADAVILNGGGIRSSVSAGNIRKKDITAVSPYSDYIWTVDLTGSQILEAIEAASAPLPQQSAAFAQVSGIEYTVDTAVDYQQGEPYPDSEFYTPADPGSRVTIHSIGGKEFDPDKVYRIATLDFTAEGGDSYFVFTQAKQASNTQILFVNGVCDYLEKAWGGIVNQYYKEPQGRVTIK